jgi:hypothetical protein
VTYFESYVDAEACRDRGIRECNVGVLLLTRQDDGEGGYMRESSPNSYPHSRPCSDMAVQRVCGVRLRHAIWRLLTRRPNIRHPRYAYIASGHRVSRVAKHQQVLVLRRPDNSAPVDSIDPPLYITALSL